MADNAQTAGNTRLATLDRVARRDWRTWWRYWVKDPFFGAYYLALHYGFRALPIDWCSALGAGLCKVIGRYWHTDAHQRALRNYLLLSPVPVTPEQADRAMSLMWSNVGRFMAEFSVLDRLWPAGRIEVVGLHHLAEARDAGRPHLMMGLHLANWEVFGPAMHALGFPGKFTYMPIPNRFQHRIAIRARKDWGKALPPTFSGSREVFRTLVEERGAIVIWVDEFIRGRGVTSPLFGRPIMPRSNLLTIVRLALAAPDCALLPFYVERLHDSARFRLTILPEVELIRSGDREAEVTANARLIDDLITPIIKARLEQWFLLQYLRLP